MYIIKHMEIRILTLILTILLSSCSIFKDRSRERKIQTDIISRLNQKADQYAKCAKENKVFQKLKQERLRVILHLSINAQGQIEKFKLDNKPYPNNFSECIFKITDTINFPKIENHELIDLEQPFIFSKK